MDEERIYDMFKDFKEDIHTELTEFKTVVRQDINKMEKIIYEYLANRLPIWASVVIAMLTALIGFLISLTVK